VEKQVTFGTKGQADSSAQAATARADEERKQEAAATF